MLCEKCNTELENHVWESDCVGGGGPAVPAEPTTQTKPIANTEV